MVDRRFLARMALTGERFSAREAAGAGCSPPWSTTRPRSTPGSTAQARGDLRKSAPGAVRATKELLRTLPAAGVGRGTGGRGATSAELFAGAEAAEGMEAFLQKRRPAWDTTP